MISKTLLRHHSNNFEEGLTRKRRKLSTLQKSSDARQDLEEEYPLGLALGVDDEGTSTVELSDATPMDIFAEPTFHNLGHFRSSEVS